MMMMAWCEATGCDGKRKCGNAGMSAVLPQLVTKVDASFRKGELKQAQAAQATLNKW